MRSFRTVLTVLAAIGITVAALAAFQGSTTTALVAGILAGWLVCAAIMSWDLGAGLVAVALAGMGVSAYLAHQHIAVAHGAVSICSVNEVFDCDAVNRNTRFGELFGIPISLFGLAFYAAMGAVALLRRLGRPGLAGAWKIILAGGAWAVAYSVFLALMSHLVIGAWCLFCISMYGLNAMLLVGGWLGVAHPHLRRPPAAVEETPSLMCLLRGEHRDRTLVTAVVAGLAVLFLAVMIYRGQEQELAGGGLATDPEVLASYYNLPAGEIALGGTEPVLGDPTAPYVILEYADYQCPWCAVASLGLKDLARATPEVQLRFRHYPLSTACNDKLSQDMHPLACNAAAAAWCAQQQGQFWEMSELMFKNQDYLSKEDVRFIARQIGLDSEAFEACMGAPATADAIRRDVAAAHRAEVHGTPTVFLRGVFGDRWVEVSARPEHVAAVIEAAKAGVPLPEPQPKTARR